MNTSVATPLAPPSSNVSRLTSDAPTILNRWGTAEERKLNEALQFVEQARARRARSVTELAEVLRAAGLDATQAETVLLHAAALRTALAPFDLSNAPS